MGVKIDEHTIKYKIIARFEVDGVVERPDIIGAVFGQTDGLLPPDLNLRDLQKTGKLGRIEVRLTSQGGKTTGIIELPTNLDKVRTAIIAATVETVDRVGPCHAKVTLEKIEDVRDAKRREIIERAAEIVKGWEEREEEFPEVTSLLEEKFKEKTSITKQDKHTKELTKEIIKFGKDKLYAGPDLPNSKEIIIVEGRADIINLLRAGIRNTIEVGGTNVPQTVIDLIRQRTATAFLDGDRGGDFILKELLQVAPPDYVARAPLGKEVEELTPEEIRTALKNKKPINEATFITEEKTSKKKSDKRKQHETRKDKGKIRRSSAQKATHRVRQSSRRSGSRTAQRGTQRSSRRREQKEIHAYTRAAHHEYPRYPPLEPALKAVINAFEKKLRGSFQSYLLDKDYVPIEQVPTEKLYERLKEINNGVHAVLYDGVLTKRISELAAEKNISVVAATVKGDVKGAPPQVRLVTFDQAK